MRSLEDVWVGPQLKAVPNGTEPFPLSELGERGWNVLREDLPLPVALLRESALEHNSRFMRRFLELTGARIAPHGKTTMSPQLFHRQLADGAVGITVATVGQLRICRDHGISRVILANQLVGRADIAYVLDELGSDPMFDFYTLVDSTAGVDRLAQAARSRGVTRPIQLLLEGGFPGGRTGSRTVEQALEVARAVHAAGPVLALRGVEGFEGLIDGPDEPETERRVAGFLDGLVEIALRVEAEGLFAPGPVILSAGGSSFHDLVARRFTAADVRRPHEVWLRSGCYLTHDSGLYAGHMDRLAVRSPAVAGLGEGPRPALEVWAHVQSRPEPGLAILTAGKRDCSFDAGLPRPFATFRPGQDGAPRAVDERYRLTGVNDQHAFLSLPDDADVAVGDLVGLGISHPCTTFDKWQLLVVVDDAYDVIGGVRTYFG